MCRFSLLVVFLRSCNFVCLDKNFFQGNENADKLLKFRTLLTDMQTGGL